MAIAFWWTAEAALLVFMFLGILACVLSDVGSNWYSAYHGKMDSIFSQRG
jgi:hypothetical protein